MYYQMRIENYDVEIEYYFVIKFTLVIQYLSFLFYFISSPITNKNRTYNIKTVIYF